MSKANYKGFEIETAQDSLGHWHATVTDTDAGTTLATTPKDDKYGTNQEQLIGTPASHGCIRLSNADIVELYDLVPAGTLVEILA